MTKNSGSLKGQEEPKNNSSDPSSQPADSLSKRESLDNETYNKQKLYREDAVLNAFYEKEHSQSLSPLSEASDEFNEHYQMSVEGFIRLFAQTSVMEAFLARDFPIGIKRRVARSIDEYIRLLCDKTFVASEGAMVVRQFFDDIEKHLGQLAGTSDFRAWHIPSGYPSAQFKKEHRLFKKECEAFLQDIKNYFALAGDIFANINDQVSLSKDSVEIWMLILNNIHHFGKRWTSEFLEFSAMGHAILYVYSLFDKVDMLQFNIEEVVKLPTSLTTRKDTKKGERRLTFTFSPWNFLLRDFKLLFFKFFHEYISHLSATMHPVKKDDGTPLLLIDRLTCDIPDELSEGWMIHTAVTFFAENASKLLDNYRHNEQEFRIVIADWTMDVINPRKKSFLYIVSAETGYTTAVKFLQLLQDEICKGDKKKACSLYYRLSFDLITYFPLNGFSHQNFLDSMQFWLHTYNHQRLVQWVQESLQIKQDRIDLSMLWSKIRYEPDDLYIPELYRPPELYRSLVSYKRDRHIS